MSRRFHPVIPLSTLGDERATGFLRLFLCDALVRSTLISLVPLQAYALLGAAQAVSVLYFLVAILGLLAILAVPAVLHHVRRRWVLTGGGLLSILSSILLACDHKASLVAGLVLQGAAGAALDVVISLYMLDHIPRRGLNTFEPRRLLFVGIAFTIGPLGGVYLSRHVAPVAPYVMTCGAMLLLLGLFWSMRLSDNVALSSPRTPPLNPLRFLRRFFNQPRLTLAWLLALGRNGWWVLYFIYAPIYAASAGYSPEAGGALITIGLAPALLVGVFGRIGRQIGIRNLMTIGYGGVAVLSFAAAIAAARGHASACLVLVCLAAWAATILDGAGNVPFLRAVHYYERAAMTSVFMTFRHVASLVVPGVLAVVLWYFPLPAVFAVGGVLATLSVVLTRYLPRQL